MKMILIILVLVVIVWVIWMIAMSVSRAAARRRLRGPWRVSEVEHDGESVNICIEKPGEESILVGQVLTTRSHWEFQEELDGLKIEAQDKADALNRKVS